MNQKYSDSIEAHVGKSWKRTDGRWACKVRFVRHGTTVKWQTVYGKTDKEVTNKARRLANHGETHGIEAASGHLKVADVMASFLEDCRHAHAVGEMKRKSLANYEYIVESRILPYLADLPVTNIDKKILNAWQAQLVGANVSASTRRNAVGRLKQAVAAAVEAGRLQVDPVASYPLPKKDREERLYWTPGEVQAFLEVARTHRLYALFMVAIEAGLRRGELMGLRWSDLDLESRTLHVRVQAVTLATAYEDTPKTKSSRRMLHLSPECVQVLRDHQTRQHLERQCAGRWTENDLVFPSTVGTFLPERRIRGALEKLAVRAKVRRIRVHDLRHTYAALAVRAGVPMELLKRRMGHASIQMTSDLYSHLYADVHATGAISVTDLVTGPARLTRENVGTVVPSAMAGLLRSMHGRYHAGRVAEVMGLSVTHLAGLTGHNPDEMNARPDDEAWQEGLKPLISLLLLLEQVGVEATDVREWLDQPLAGETRTALALLEAEKVEQVTQAVVLMLVS